MTVRPIRPDDVPAVLGMVRELAAYEESGHEAQMTGEQLTGALFGESPALFGHVATPDGAGDGELAGFALWFLNFSTWRGTHGIYLEDLYVRPEHRGHGFGRLLLARLARECVERGYSRLEWSVLDWNEPALGFYRRIGAVAMDGWTVHRLDGDALSALGAASP